MPLGWYPARNKGNPQWRTTRGGRKMLDGVTRYPARLGHGFRRLPSEPTCVSPGAARRLAMGHSGRARSRAMQPLHRRGWSRGDAVDELDQAGELFDWTARNVQLEARLARAG